MALPGQDTAPSLYFTFTLMALKELRVMKLQPADRVNPVFLGIFEHFPQLFLNASVQTHTSRLHGPAFLRQAGPKGGGESTWIAPF
jgi:hypothetical protein